MISMLRNRILRRKSATGFTLVELAIVLAVTGVLFVGLYRLLSGGNAQVKDSSAASQQIQLINAVKIFLNSSGGSQWMAASGSGASVKLNLPDTSADAADGGTNTTCHAYMDTVDPALDTTHGLEKFCDALPSGFYKGTVNSFGQTFEIQVKVGTFVVPATAPSTYSFMVKTSSVIGTPDLISDADGGRISSEIGTDGGFVYHNATICPAGIACGSYGAWTASPVADYGFGEASAGEIASRTYYSPETDFSDVWLARKMIDSPPTTTTPGYNTMTTDLLLGGKTFWLGSAISNAAAPTITGGGTINLQQGEITDTNSNGNALILTADGGGAGSSYLGSATGQNAFGTLSTFCTSGGPSTVHEGDAVGTLTYHAGCIPAIQIFGDEYVTGQVNSYSFYASTFYYNTTTGTSDLRVKKDIKPVASALDKIMEMKPVSFTFKSSDIKGMGFIAQDMEKIYPDLVREDSRGLKGIQYDGLLAPLVDAVQDLKRQNDELRSELKETQARQKALEKALDKQP